MENFILQNNISTIIESGAIISAMVKPKTDISGLLERFDPITLEEMDSVKLMNRIDTKFLVGMSQLMVLLERSVEHYRVVEIDGKRISPYSTIYFDTPDTIMYMMHHNGKLNRYKIRTRSYIESGISFLEIKRKNNKGRTSKKRISIPTNRFRDMNFNDEEEQFVLNKSPYQAVDLKPQVQSSFRRITLVDKRLSERVTIDLNLCYKKIINGANKNLNGLVIIEMKQDGACKSHFRQYLNELKIRPGSMSKYCLGMVLLNPDIKSNKFKNKIRKITKITENYYDTI